MLCCRSRVSRVERRTTEVDADSAPSPSAGAGWRRLPSYAYSEEIERIADQHDQEGKPLPFMCAAGPALPWAWCGFALSWCTVVLMLAIGLTFSQCSNDQTFTTYPSWVYFVIMLLCFIRGFCEAKCHTYVSIPFVQGVGLEGLQGPMFGLKMSYNVWFCFYALKSALELTDMSMDSLLTSKVITSEHCDDTLITVPWRAYSSWVGPFAVMTLSAVGITVWFLVWIQAVYCLFEVLPAWSELASIQCRAGVGPEFKHNYKLMCGGGREQNNGSALHALSEGCGMVLMCAHSPSYQRSKYEVARDANDRSEEYYSQISKCLIHIKSASSIMVARTGLNGIVENGLQVNVQVTLFCIGVAVEKSDRFDTSQLQTLMSIILSLLFAVDRIFQAVKFVRWYYWEVRVDFADVDWATGGRYTKLEHGSCLADGSAIGAENLARGFERMDSIKLAEAKADWDQVQRNVRAVVISAAVLMGLVLYATIRFVMAFRCEHALWNIKGCADLPQSFIQKLDLDK